MTSSEFLVDDYFELLALHRAVMEAKFCDEPNDNDVSGSPIVASLHKKLVEKLVEAEVERRGESARVAWIEWLALSDERREWTVAIARARADSRWAGWNDEGKREYSRSLLAPFTFSDALLDRFVELV